MFNRLYVRDFCGLELNKILELVLVRAPKGEGSSQLFIC